MRCTIICALSIFSLNVLAIDNPYTMRSPQALLMGDAFTAVNDDDYTLFYNAASLARHKSDFTLYPFNPQINGTNILSDIDKYKKLPDDPVGFSDLLLDNPVHASVGVAPGFKFFNVGVSFISSENFDLLLRNRSNPMLDLDFHRDKGVLLGVGIPIGPSRINKKSQTGSQTSIGVSGKYIERTGVRDTLALLSPTVLGSIDQDEVQKVLKSLGQVKSIGYGVDAGLEHVSRSGSSQFVFGLSALDIGGTHFKEASSTDKIQVSDIKSQFNLGVAYGHDFNFFHYILSADVRGLNEQMDFTKRTRVGAQVGLLGLKLLAGMNSGYYSYGASLDIGILRIVAGFYDVELGSTAKQVQSKRFVFYLSLFDFSFDA